jgi:hypothetical protein
MKNLFKAVAGFQYEVKPIFKGNDISIRDKQSGQYKKAYSYADLKTIVEAITPLLEKHGLGFMQHLRTKDNTNFIETIIFHVESGETIKSEVMIPFISLDRMNDYQSFGSGVSYYRRYALSCALGLVTDEDKDDSGEQIRKTENKPAQKIALASLSGPEFNECLRAIHNGEYTKEELLKDFKLSPEQTLVINNL